MSLTTSLVSYYKMDEASGNALDAHGSNDFTENGTIGTSTGIISSSRTFDGSSTQFVHATNSDFETGDIDFEFQVWVYFNTLGNAGFISKWPAGDEYTLIYVGGRVQWTILDGGGTQRDVVANTFGALSTNTWYLVRCWHDSVNNEIGVSVNGVADSLSVTAGVAVHTNNIYFGVLSNMLFIFDGRLDEIGFWKRILTSQERTDLYNAGAGLAYPFTPPATGNRRRRVLCGAYR